MANLSFNIKAANDSAKVVGEVVVDLEQIGITGKKSADTANSSFGTLKDTFVTLNQGIGVVKAGFSVLSSAITAPTSAFSSLVSTSFDLVDAWDVHASALAQLETSFKSQGAAASQNLDEWEAWAEGVEDATGVAQATILKLAAQAGSVVGFSDEMKTAVELAIDVAEAADRSVGEALGSMTRATQNGSFELARHGTEALKAKDELGRLAEVIDLTGDAFGGFAAAARNPIDRVRSAVRNLKIQLGEVVIETPEFKSFLSTLQSQVKRFTDFIKTDSKEASNIFGLVFKTSFDLASISAAALTSAIGKVGSAVFQLIDGLAFFKIINIEDPVEDQFRVVTELTADMSNALHDLKLDFEELLLTTPDPGLKGVLQTLIEEVEHIDFVKVGGTALASARLLGEQIAELIKVGIADEELEIGIGEFPIDDLIKDIQKLAVESEKLDELRKKFDFTGRAARATAELQKIMENFSVGNFKKEMEDANRAEREAQAEAANLGDATNDVGQAAEGASQALDQYGEKAKKAGDSSEEGAKGVKTLAERLEEAFQFGSAGDQRGQPPPVPKGATGGDDFVKKSAAIGDALGKISGLFGNIDNDADRTIVHVNKLGDQFQSAFQTMGDSAQGVAFIQDLLAEIGTELGALGDSSADEAFEDLAKSVNALISPAEEATSAIESVKGAAESLPDEVKVKIKAEVSAAGGKGAPAASAGKSLEEAANAVESAAEALSSAVTDFESGTGSAALSLESAGESLQTAADGQSDAVSSLASASDQLASVADLLSATSDAHDEAADALSNAATTITTATTDAAAALISSAVSLKAAGSSLSKAANDLGKNITINVQATSSAHGSVQASGASLHIVHSPEVVLPLNERGLKFAQSAFGPAIGQSGGGVGGRSLVVQGDLHISGVNDVDAMLDEIEARLSERQTDRAGFG